jgi:hypothetical protein
MKYFGNFVGLQKSILVQTKIFYTLYFGQREVVFEIKKNKK